MSCPYRDILGKSKEGVHKHRTLGFATVDTVLTALLAFVISRKDFVRVFIGLMLLSVILHKLFCVDSTLTVLVFGETSSRED